MAQEEGLSHFILQLPLKQRVPVVALSKLLIERQQIDNQQQQSIAKIKQSYQAKLKPLLQRASQIIRGAPLKEEQVQDAALAQFVKPTQNIKNYLKGKIIPEYWNGVLANSPLVDEVTEADQKAISYLIDIQNVYPQNKAQNQGISLKFVFKENPYFNQTQIIRNLRMSSGQMLALEGTQLTWKQGKWLTHQKKKITNKKTGQSKIEQGKKIKSFFDIFLDWNVENPKQLSKVGNFIIELGNMIIMDSLDYFLGLINCDENSDNDQDQQDEQQDEQLENGKKVKQN